MNKSVYKCITFTIKYILIKLPQNQQTHFLQQAYSMYQEKKYQQFCK